MFNELFSRSTDYRRKYFLCTNKEELKYAIRYFYEKWLKYNWLDLDIAMNQVWITSIVEPIEKIVHNETKYCNIEVYWNKERTDLRKWKTYQEYLEEFNFKTRILIPDNTSRDGTRTVSEDSRG